MRITSYHVNFIFIPISVDLNSTIIQQNLEISSHNRTSVRIHTTYSTGTIVMLAKTRPSTESGVHLYQIGSRVIDIIDSVWTRTSVHHVYNMPSMIGQRICLHIRIQISEREEIRSNQPLNFIFQRYAMLKIMARCSLMIRA